MLAEQHRDDLAGIIVSAFRHDAGHDQELPTPAFAQGVRTLCDELGAVLILDDVRAGFRLALGSSWEPLGVRPDLSAWSKALGNGYPIAAALGVESLRATAESIFATGSFWMSAVPMAAAVATIELLAAEDGVARMRARGEQLVGGLRAQAVGHGLGVVITGPPALPYLRFADEHDHQWTERWAAACVAGGVFLHPRHNWFMSTALTEADIDQALLVTDAAFGAVAGELNP